MVTDFKKKQKSGLSKISIVLGGVIILLIIILLVIANIRIYQKRAQFISRIEDLKNKVKEAKNKNADLKEIISSSDNDEYTERIAREELDLQKPGEKVFSFIRESDDAKKENNIWSKNTFHYWRGIISGWLKNKI